MTESMKKLLEIVSGSKELAAKIGGMGKEEIIALARELGVALTEADFAQKCELSDDELDTVVGGVSVGDRVKMDSRMVRYCPGCGKLASTVCGTVVGKMYYEKGGYYFVNVKSDCCGYVERALESICSVQ